jgi:hypothetical protein
MSERRGMDSRTPKPSGWIDILLEMRLCFSSTNRLIFRTQADHYNSSALEQNVFSNR